MKESRITPEFLAGYMMVQFDNLKTTRKRTAHKAHMMDDVLFWWESVEGDGIKVTTLRHVKGGL